MTPVSRETQLLSGYGDLIRKWNPAINLVAPSTLDQLETRHIADCRQLADVSQGTGGSWVDIGSGAGLPGLVMAILRPDIAVALIESDKRKSAFLRNCIRELGLENARVVNDRIEAVTRLDAANLSARALAPLPALMQYVHMHLRPSGTAWLMKGRNWKAEVEDAKVNWKFDLTAHQSETDPDAAILEITGIEHV